MNVSLKAGLVSAALAVATLAAPALSADLGRGSLKDPGYHAVPVAQGSVGNCYFRADVGYSRSNGPSVKWPVNSRTDTFDATDINDVNTYVFTGSNFTFIGDTATNVELENTWLGEAGFGCGSGSLGLRAELMLGGRGERKLDAVPPMFTNQIVVNQIPAEPVPETDPLHTTLRTYTFMANVYKDLGNYGGFTPYVGVGVGAAYHQVGDVFFTGNPFLVNKIKGANDLAFAWSLMAGVGYQISDRAIIDLGYRYFDFGKAASDRVDSAGFVNPRVKFDDITAHEFKVGLRYHFGHADCCTSPISLK